MKDLTMIKQIKAYKCSDKKLFTKMKNAIAYEIALKHLGTTLSDNDPDLWLEDSIYMAYTYIKNKNKIIKTLKSHSEESDEIFLGEWLMAVETFVNARDIEDYANYASKFILNDIEYINHCIEESTSLFKCNLL